MNDKENSSSYITYVLLKINRHVWRFSMARSWLKWLVIVTALFIITSMCIFFNGRIIESKTPSGITNILTVKYDTKATTEIAQYQQHEPPTGQIFTKTNCNNIHIALVCAGFNSSQLLTTVVKSIMFYRSRPIYFHILVDEVAKKTLETLFSTWNLPQVTTSFYPVEEWIPRVAWIPNKHYSGVYGLLKLLLPDILAKEERVLVLDTDLTILTDISSLWDIFDKFTEKQIFGLAENQSNWYKRKVSYGQRVWPALGRGFNTGVMLLNLAAHRRMKLDKIWMKTTLDVLQNISSVSLADQDVINAVINEYPDIVYKIECGWNVQLSDHALSEECYSQAEQIRILHWNSPRKQEVKNKHSIDFVRMHRVFLEMDGNLLRRKLFQCSQQDDNLQANRTDICEEFTKASTTIYRTHLYFFEYEYSIHSNPDITLVTQCSVDRITSIDELCKRWPGTISIAVYLTDAEVQYFIDFIRTSVMLRNRKNIAYHIVYKEGEFYPVNYLRNIAISQASTPYVFQLDVDFLPQTNLYANLMSSIIKLNITESDKTALIVPAFETQRYRFTFPTNKDELLKYLSYGILYTFRYHVWARGHAATNYSCWKTAVEPYEVNWEPDFEPYVVVPRDAPLYDKRFVGFGWNKVSYITHLTAIGYKYIVLPDAFIIHRPHGPSRDIGKFRTDPVYRRCLKKLKDQFVEELIDKYGDVAISRIKKITKEQKESQ